ncbi:hypothetical protein Ddye_000521 [Dipteronia dyeriana]|uniref:Uncharacterized protein n=1 Tax=Dipteronia dyeriana TaxID=168575 RepID=A0AAE0CSM2_9ROSI|nr:hypothetical protein Ddye_000521 [Dipteronia dyeriana]
MDWSFAHKASGEPLTAALLINYDPTGPSRLLSTIDSYTALKSLFDGILMADMVTSIHENWFCARCMNTLQPSEEGAIVMQTKAFILVALEAHAIFIFIQSLSLPEYLK